MLVTEEVNELIPISNGKEDGKIKRDTKFKVGHIANPNGRPRGTRNKYTIAVQNLLDGEAVALSRRAVELALQGDTVALRLCLERILPPRRDTPVVVPLNKIQNAQDAVNAQSAILEAACNGEITPSEATALSGIAQQAMKAIEMQELSDRIAKLETKYE